MKTVEFIESTPEPVLIAYRADLKKMKEFYSVDECAEFFNCEPISIKKPSRGYDGHHMTGRKINQKWYVFRTEMKKRDVSEYLQRNKTDNLTFR